MKATDEIRVGDIYALLVRRKWSIIATTIALMLSAMVAALILPKQYVATTTIAVSSESMDQGGVGGGQAMLSSFGGLASMIGLSRQTASPEAVDVATLKSLILTEKFAEVHQLAPILFGKYWNATTRRWTGKYRHHAPTVWDTAEFFRKKVISLVVHPKTGLIEVSASWTDPKLAAQWSNDIVAMTNSYLREKSIREIQREIAYLEGQATQTSDISVREGIYSLIRREVGRMTIVQGNRQFAFSVIDPAFVPERPYSPRPVLWSLAGMLAGLILSSGMIIMRAGWDSLEEGSGASRARTAQLADSGSSGAGSAG